MSKPRKNYNIIHSKDKKWKVDTKIKRLGGKTEPYYETEEEMLRLKIYDYESLSESEKEIYDKGKKT